MKIIQKIITNNESYIKGEKFTPYGIVLHSIGTPQPNGEVLANLFNEFNPGGQKKSVHGFIDARLDQDNTLYQTMPFNMIAWHAGGYNATHIGIEMCEPPGSVISYDGGIHVLSGKEAEFKQYMNKLKSSAIYLFAQLCVEYNITPNKSTVLSHKECNDGSGHVDPNHLFDLIGYTMDQFRSDVTKTMESIKSNGEKMNFPEVPIQSLNVNQLYMTSTYAPFTEKEDGIVLGFDYNSFIHLFEDGKTYFDYLNGAEGLDIMDLYHAAESNKRTHVYVGDTVRVGLNKNPEIDTFEEFADLFIVDNAVWKDVDGNKVVHEFMYCYDSNESTRYVFLYRVYYKDLGPDHSSTRVFFDNPTITNTTTSLKGTVVTIDGNSTISAADLEEVQRNISKTYLYDENGNSLYGQMEDMITAYNNGTLSTTVENNIFDTRPILGIFGIPYQFMPHVDPRITQTEQSSDRYVKNYAAPGVEYSDHILSNMPLLFLSPGFPDFMTNFTKEQRVNLLEMLGVANNGDDIDAFLDSVDLGKKSGKYYTFRYAVAEYYMYCNPICRIASAYLGINQEQIDGVNIESLDWRQYTSAPLNSIFGGLIDPTSYSSIPFYIDSETQINDTFSNDTTESSLASNVNNFSSIGRDLTFTMGYTQARTEKFVFNVSQKASDSYKGLREMLEGLAGNSDVLKNLAADVISVASGGKLLFPKIWGDSSFSRSYDVTIKLRSPDNDPLSIYLNVLVPFFHLFCMSVPRVGDDNPNALFSPFIVRAIYKGFFNIDMGLITSLAVTKGDTGQWTPDGVPTCIDISMSIADLYENISITKTETADFSFSTTSNTALMDYIANTCGINIYQPEIARVFRMYIINNTINRAKDLVNIGVWGQLKDNISNAITKVWRPRL